MSDHDYWLSRCQGFAVEEGDHHIGQVDSIEYETSIDVPDFIVIRTSRFTARVTRIAVDDVERISPSERVLVVHRRPG